MARLVLSQNVCLDGAVQDPIGAEGIPGGGWFTEMTPAEYEEWGALELDEAKRAQALLMGRRTDEFFGRGWNTREGDWAETLRALPKYVVSSTASQACFTGGTVLSGPVLDEVNGVRARHDGDVLVFGSAQLVHTLWENDLVDELRLTVHPFVGAGGGRLLPRVATRRSLQLVGSRAIGGRLLHLTYEVAR